MTELMHLATLLRREKLRTLSLSKPIWSNLWTAGRLDIVNDIIDQATSSCANITQHSYHFFIWCNHVKQHFSNEPFVLNPRTYCATAHARSLQVICNFKLWSKRFIFLKIQEIRANGKTTKMSIKKIKKIFVHTCFKEFDHAVQEHMRRSLEYIRLHIQLLDSLSAPKLVQINAM